MRRMIILAAAGAVAVAVGVISSTLVFTARGPVATVTPAKVTEPELVTGTIAPRPIAEQPLPQPPLAAAVSASANSAAFPTSDYNVATARSPACENPDALGVSRVVEIDTTGGPGFGFEHFKAYDFLREHEVVLTFDDGPWPGNTPAVLKALADQCTKALFFPIGKHAMWHPEILKQVAAAGHTIGSPPRGPKGLFQVSGPQSRGGTGKGKTPA